MDRWAGTDPEYDRWGRAEPEYDRWAEDDPEYDRWAEAGHERDRRAQTDRQHDRWPGRNRQYDRHDRLTGSAGRPKVKWFGLLIAWVIVAGLLLAVHLTILIWVIMVGLIGYVIYSVRRDTPHAGRPPRRRAPTADFSDDGRERFNAPPGWPEPPPGWSPHPGWQPNPAWPPAPPGWQFWLPPARRPARDGTRRYRRDDRDDADDFWSTS